MKKNSSLSQSCKSRINWVDDVKPLSREEFYREIEEAKKRKKNRMWTVVGRKKLVLKRNYGKLNGKGRVVTTIIR